MKRLALIGSKVFALQIRSFAEKTGEYEVIGYFDDFSPKGTIIEGLPILGKIQDIIPLYQNNVFDCLFFAAGYNNFKFRAETFSALKGKVPFANIIMPNAKLLENVQLGEGVFIGGGTVIDPNTIIEDNVFIHGGSGIGHDNHIGAHTYISGRFNSAGFVNIGSCCFMGICVLVSDHISICNDTWIGLGCIVAKDIITPGKYMSPSAKLYKIE